MEYKNLFVEVEYQILTVTLNRPKSMNALNIATMVELEDVFVRYQYDRSVSGVIVTGAGEKAFVAGADIAEFSDFDAAQGKTMGQNGHKIFNRIEDYSKPVIAAVNGFALGGGCELAMACHIRVASDRAKFGQPEVSLGIIPGYGGTQRLVELIGKGRALELLMTGDMIDAQTALNYGLVNHVVTPEELISKSTKILKKIGSKGPVAISNIIKAVNTKYRGGGAVGDSYEVEIESFAQSFNTEDFAEGTSAFLAKRKPDFKGR
jgi:enoyl-CoA hydratase